MASDVSILFGLLLFLIGLGIFAPMMQQALGQAAVQENVTGLDVGPPSYNWWEVYEGYEAFKGIITALFWTFNWFPIWLQALHIVIRLTAIFIGVRLVRGTG